MNTSAIKNVAIIVAHPDDETLWAGGTLLLHPGWQCFIVCLCRKSDPDRAPKFEKVLGILHARGIMGDLDDGPAQTPLNEAELESTILHLLPSIHYDLIITHNPNGEYTRHVRHEETSKAVIQLWERGKISTNELWTFAYEDGGRTYYPQAIANAPLYQVLPQEIWVKKYKLITETYGFEKKSWEAQSTPQAEAFWQFFAAAEAVKWLLNNRVW